MSRRIALILSLNLILVGGVVSTLVAQQPGAAKGAPKAKGPQPGKNVAPRAGLFFKEVWKQNEQGSEQAMTQANVANADLELKLYGCGGPEGMLMTGFDNNDANPMHTWTGVCEGPSLFTLRHKTKLADLTGSARLRVNAKTSGFHVLRPVVKTADGIYLIADVAVGTPADFLVSEYNFGEMRWIRLNAAKVTTTGNWVATPDLTSIDEIGFADLMPGSGHGPGGWADVAQIEVYANSKPRQ
jgi:hypothetical protein